MSHSGGARLAELWFGSEPGSAGGATVALSGGGVNVRLSGCCLTLTCWRREGKIKRERGRGVTCWPPGYSDGF
ncbi:hypothetical protein M3J09_006656 [Ascochyta lentis]